MNFNLVRGCDVGTRLPQEGLGSAMCDADIREGALRETFDRRTFRRGGPAGGRGRGGGMYDPTAKAIA